MNSSIPVNEIQKLIQTEPPYLIDVRDPDEFALGTLPGAVNFPLSELEKQIPNLPQGGMIVTFCNKGGGRSEKAANILKKTRQAPVFYLEGGYLAWQGVKK
ncbi:MAG: rhodanese-like domain-containing protein [Candidatus Sericytochromatia bacterium]